LATALFLPGCRPVVIPPFTHARLSPDDTLTILSYNVENLFDLVRNGNEYQEYIPDSCNWNHETFGRKIDNISGVIQMTHPSIVALCEVENRMALKHLRKMLDRKGCGLRYAAVADSPATGTTATMLLSRFPIIAIKSYPVNVSTDRLSRNILEAVVDCGPCSVTVFVNHWPSQYNDDAQRITAASVLEKRLRYLSPSVQYVVTGDFNCNWDSAFDSTNALTWLVQSMAYISRNEDLPQESMYDLWAEVPSYCRFSYIYKHQYETPDHMIISKNLYRKNGLHYVAHSFGAIRLNGRLMLNGAPWRWAMDYQKSGKKIHRGEGYSDHLPIMATFVYHGP
jgi:hypothetical protein